MLIIDRSYKYTVQLMVLFMVYKSTLKIVNILRMVLN